MGYGVIEVNGSSVVMREMDVLKLPAKKDSYKRLLMIHQKIEELIASHHPHEFAIEAPFFGKNVQSMLKLGRAQGVAIAAALRAGLPVTEYSPRKIKQAITGNGNAGKEQVWKMLQRILVLKESPKYYDATDALAVALCHHFQGLPSRPVSKKEKNWKEFISNNPTRISKR